MKEDTILQNDTPKMTLRHNGENIFREFKRGLQIFAAHNDISYLGSTFLITTGNNNQMEVNQMVTHVEYKIPTSYGKYSTRKPRKASTI